jgi:hypothetical protein
MQVMISTWHDLKLGRKTVQGMQETRQHHGQQGWVVTQVVLGGYTMIISGGSCPRTWGCAGKYGGMAENTLNPQRSWGIMGENYPLLVR